MCDIRRAIEKNGYILHTIKGISMTLLLLEATDIVKLVPAPEPLQEYDIALFSRGDLLVLHRVLKINNDGSYIICGDHQEVQERVNQEQILAVAEGYFRGEEYHVLRDCNGPVVAPDYKKFLDAHTRRVMRPHPLRCLRRTLSPIYHKIKGDR